MLLFCVTVLVIVVTVGYGHSFEAGSGQHMIDAGWMDQSNKFKMIARWGLK